MSNNNSRRSIFLPLMLAGAMAAGIITGIYLPGRNNLSEKGSIRIKNDKIEDVLDVIESNYVDTVNRKEMVETAIPAILRKLDPHSVYIPARDFKRANEPLEGNFEGIGISFSMLTDTILVISTVPGGPSEKIGLEAGDKILYVNDSLVAGRHIDDNDVLGMLRGPRGSVVKVKVLRKGFRDLLSFSITRDKIPIYSVDVAYMPAKDIGYIRINNFAVTTFEEFMNGLRDLKRQGMTKLIIDLRGNAGGVMESAVQIANQFLKEGQLIVYHEGRKQPRREARATGNGEFESGELVILIDEWSASASEILAGAIQDNDRGTIIGRRSFGKGLVQEQVEFPDGSGLRLTVARYYTPTGRSIQKPYNNGYDEYYNDLNIRYSRGEFEVPDSIHFADSLKFITPGGRIVYGGGGIMPDLFVPVDTTEITEYFIKVRPFIYQFSLKYSENNRENLKKYTEPGELEKFLDKQQLIKQFTDFTVKSGVKTDPVELRISEKLIHTQLEAYIARNILDNKGFYPIWEKIDTTLKYAIEYLGK